MALCIGRQIALADAATDRELTGLPTQPCPTPLNFSPDGTKLVVGTDRNTVLVWDLRRIRDHLAPIGLDWDAPPTRRRRSPAKPKAHFRPGPCAVVGEVIDNQARRARDLAHMNCRLAANRTTPMP